MGEVLKVFIAATTADLGTVRTATKRLGGELRSTRRRGFLIGGAIAVALATITSVIGGNIQPAGATFGRERIRANLIAHIEQRAQDDIAKLDGKRDGKDFDREKSAREWMRAQQLEDVDRFLEQIARAFEKKEATANYTRAVVTLDVRGVPEALRFLESQSGAREAEITRLTRAKVVDRHALHGLLREKLFTASLLEEDAQWDKAEAEYRAAVRNGGTWPEARNALARLLWQPWRALQTGPSGQNPRLREAARLCRGTLAANPRKRDPEAWADTQFVLGSVLASGLPTAGQEELPLPGQAVAAFRAALQVHTRAASPRAWAATQSNIASVLFRQSMEVEWTEGQRLMREAVVTYLAVLEVDTRAQWPLDWAKTQHMLGATFWVQGRRTKGAGGLRLFREAVAAYRASLEVQTRENSPQNWAATQYRLGDALGEQAARSEGAEGQRLLGEAVSAYRAALEVRTTEELDGPVTLNSLRKALRALSARTTGAEAERWKEEAEDVDRELVAP